MSKSTKISTDKKNNLTRFDVILRFVVLDLIFIAIIVIINSLWPSMSYKIIPTMIKAALTACFLTVMVYMNLKAVWKDYKYSKKVSIATGIISCSITITYYTIILLKALGVI